MPVSDVSGGTTVLLYRLGSLGDSVVSLPTLKLVARAFHDDNRVLLTNFPDQIAPPVKSVIHNMGIAHGYLEYPVGTRNPLELLTLARRIRALRARTLVYLTARKSLTQTLRDIVFFRACGIREIIGAPLRSDQRTHRHDPATGLWESEAARLARCIASIGDSRLEDSRSWSLELTQGERAAGAQALAQLAGVASFIVVAAGAKISAKDWSVDNWRVVVSEMGRLYPDHGLVLVGAGSESQRGAFLASVWPGPALNLCGRLPPRISAAVMEHARLFVGHDGGPMHLAAAVNTPIVAIFSARAQRGIWFPHQASATIFYTDVSCAGCSLETCEVEKQRCLTAISPHAVVAACQQKLEAATEHRRASASGPARQ